MVGRKRGSEEPLTEGANEDDTAGSRKRGRGGAGGEIVFECTICGKACSTPSDRTKHMRTHSGDRPYACTTCGMAFSESGSLTKHMRIHTGECPYACTSCGEAFSTSSNLTRHCANVHALDQE